MSTEFPIAEKEAPWIALAYKAGKISEAILAQESIESHELPLVEGFVQLCAVIASYDNKEKDDWKSVLTASSERADIVLEKEIPLSAVAFALVNPESELSNLQGQLLQWLRKNSTAERAYSLLRGL